MVLTGGIMMAKNIVEQQKIDDKIIDVSTREQYMKNMSRYSLYVLFNRYVPSIQDGLVPVQRRILYCMMNDIRSLDINRKRKSASVIGTVIAKYHSHGDCLFGDTPIYLLNGYTKTIRELYESGITSFEALGYDSNIGKTIPIVIHSIRIGQYTNEIYHIELSNGTEIRCTGNHPILMTNKMYKCARDIKPGEFPLSMRLTTMGDKYLRMCSPFATQEHIHKLVSNYYYGDLPEGCVRHHIDENILNNTRLNLTTLTKREHMLLHNDYAVGLINGRKSLKDPHSYANIKNYLKNQELMKLYNVDQNFRNFKIAIKKLRDLGLEPTIENYESLRVSSKVYRNMTEEERKKVHYNLPTIEVLIQNGYGSSFEELVAKEIPTIKELYAQKQTFKSVLYQLVKQERDFSNCVPNDLRLLRCIHFILEAGYTGNLYDVFKTCYPGWNTTYEHFMEVFNTYINYYPMVTNVWVERVNNEPMYDFTSDLTENMFIPLLNAQMCDPNNASFVCVHNSSVYGACKKLANWFECKQPLICYDSNSGSIQGDPQAAMRYTESYLSPLAVDLVLGDLLESKNAVDWIRTFDNHTVEPEYLPVKIPLLLVNGTFKIAISERIEVPPHSLNDVIDATIELMNNPNASVVLIPDPCQKCEIVKTDFKKISNNGFGYFTERGIIETHTDPKGFTSLHIKSVPDLVWPNAVIEKINKLVESNKLIQISSIQDHSTDEQLDIRLYLKKGADPEFVKQVLYKNTALQDVKRVNMQVVLDNEIKQIGYKTYLIYFIDFRRNIKFRLYNARLQKAETRLHTIEVFISILESGDVEQIIHAIRNQSPQEEAHLVSWLMNKLKITDLQAKFILNTEIKKLSKSNLRQYKEEQKELKRLVDGYIKMITSPELIDAEIKQELLDIKAKYGRPRQSVLISEGEASSIPTGLFKTVVYDNGSIKKLLVDDPVRSLRGANATCVTIGENDKDLALFDELGRVFKLPIHKIPFSDRSSPGTDIRLLLKKLTSNIISTIYLPLIEELASSPEKHYLVSLTRSGLIKKIDLDDIVNSTPSGIIFSKLNKDDLIADVTIAKDTDDVIIYTHSKALRISMISVPYLKRATLGNIAIKSDLPIDGMSIITQKLNNIVVVTNKGYFNRLPESGMLRSDRSRAGSKIIKLVKNDYIIGIYACTPEGGIRCYHYDGAFTDIQTNSIEIGSTVSTGVKLVKDVVKSQLINL